MMAPQVFWQVGCHDGKCDHMTHHTHHPNYDPAAFHDWLQHFMHVHNVPPSIAAQRVRDIFNNLRPTSPAA